MVIEKIIGNIKNLDINGLEPDMVELEWYEVEKKILHKISKNGISVGIRNKNGHLHDGDILQRDESMVLVVEVKECPCIAIKPSTMIEMGKACYEMGNRHAPLFIEGDEILTPFDEPLMVVLLKCGFHVTKKSAKLIVPLGGNMHGHSHSHGH